jgi:lipopolysaccharide/colanic/teichoic acid biosynthesis glycosyltransferase
MTPTFNLYRRTPGRRTVHALRRDTSLPRPTRLAEVVGPHAVQGGAPDARVATAELPRYLQLRRTFDQLTALALLLACSPLLLALILIVRLTSQGPAIYTQRRVGLNGRVFTVYKFRSMRVDAEQGTGAVWSQPGDPRVTPVGRFLRWSHLDELPQLVNILRGEMALIGPRPERPEIVEALQREIPGYCDRLAVLPGVTGLAQVTLPPDADLGSVHRKTIMDRQYIRTASLALDLHILFCTVMMAFGLQRRLDARVWQAFA